MKKVRGLDLKFARQEANIFQFTLAAELGIPPTTLSQIESGREQMAIDEELTKGLTPAKILATIEQLNNGSE